MMNVKAFGLTHVGRQRQHNEDSFLVESDARLFLVADGMGGHAAGEIASKIVVESINEFIVHTKEDDGTWPHAYDEQYKRSTNRLMAAVRMANTRVLGGALQVSPDATEIEAKTGDVYLLCSDGLTGMVPEDEILRLVTSHDGDLEGAAQALIDTANERGGLDNITAVLVRTE